MKDIFKELRIINKSFKEISGGRSIDDIMMLFPHKTMRLLYGLCVKCSDLVDYIEDEIPMYPIEIHNEYLRDINEEIENILPVAAGDFESYWDQGEYFSNEVTSNLYWHLQNKTKKLL